MNKKYHIKGKVKYQGLTDGERAVCLGIITQPHPLYAAIEFRIGKKRTRIGLTEPAFVMLYALMMKAPLPELPKTTDEKDTP